MTAENFLNDRNFPAFLSHRFSHALCSWLQSLCPGRANFQGFREARHSLLSFATLEVSIQVLDGERMESVEEENTLLDLRSAQAYDIRKVREYHTAEQRALADRLKAGVSIASTPFFASFCVSTSLPPLPSPLLSLPPSSQKSTIFWMTTLCDRGAKNRLSIDTCERDNGITRRR